MEVVHGNRGLCAGPCRLPYSLLDENDKELDTGYLLSPRDLMGASSIPDLIKAGVSCLKIEGRLKNPEYVGIVTRFYRKLIDITYDNLEKTNDEILKLLINEENKINPNTAMSYLEELKQSFNRGGFSSGHFPLEPNKELIYQQKASNTGFYLGKVQNFHPNKGYITLKLEHSIGIGDKIAINSDNYAISELMKGNSNIRTANAGDIVTIGRMKGNIKQGQQLFKMQSKTLNDDIAPTFQEDKEFKKIELNAIIDIKRNQKISIEVYGAEKNSLYYNERIISSLEYIPDLAQKAPITKDAVISQISKTGNTPFTFKNITVNLEEDLFVPVKILNELRRTCLEALQEKILEKHIRSRHYTFNSNSLVLGIGRPQNHVKTISLLLNILNENTDYDFYLNGIDKLYIPLKYFVLAKFQEQLKSLCKKFHVYIYMPYIIRDMQQFDFNHIVEQFSIKGFAISSISQIAILKKYHLELIGNYTLNAYNQYTIQALKDLGIQSLCITPELNDIDTNELIKTSCLPLELWVYGNIPLMTMNYCLLGKSNKCYQECPKFCLSNKRFYLKDRFNFKFRISPDRFLNLTTIYNSKITSFDDSAFQTDSLRINILEETPEEIKQIISNVRKHIPFKGNLYCGHFNKIEP